MGLLKLGKKGNNMDEFEKNIFVNCPFDKDFMPLLKSLLFTIISCKFNPRIALERFDSGEIRLVKIQELIESSKYSIHDLSRIKSKDKDEYFRLNMPFEIGLDLGCKLYHSDAKYRSKKILILEAEQYSYQKALSDLSNSDVVCHKSDAEELVFAIRNWLSEFRDVELPGGSCIWDDYNYFQSDLYDEMMKKGLKDKDIERMPIRELLLKMNEWIATKKRV